MDSYRQFWQAKDMKTAWLKIVSEPEDNITETERVAGLVLPETVRGGVALEIGAGVGRLMRMMSPYFDQVWGVDLSESMIKLSEKFLENYPTCKISLNDGYTIPFSDNKFDFVYSFIVFQHMPTIAYIRSNIKEIYRVLKPGGTCRIQTIQGPAFDREVYCGQGHYFNSEEDFSKEFSKCGFKTKSFTTFQYPVNFLWVDGSK